jgi:hypothetical protein
MSISRMRPPLDYLREASPASLESFELARLNHAANLRREIGTLIDQWIKETSEALLARWMLESRRTPLDPPYLPPDILQAFSDPTVDSATDSRISQTNLVPAPPRFSDSRRPINNNVARKPQKQRPAVGE